MAPARIRLLAACLVGYVAAVVLGRLAVLQDTGLALFWPAAGVAALWMLRGRTAREVALDGALLMLTTTAYFAWSIGPLAGLALGVANLGQGLVVRLLHSRIVRRPFLEDQAPGIGTAWDMLRLAAVSVAAGVVGALPGSLAVEASGGAWTWMVPVTWVVRNACGTFVVAGAVLAVVSARRERPPGQPRLTSEPRRGTGVELGVVLATTVVAGVLVFSAPAGMPLAFLLIGTSSWVGFRFSPAVGAVHSLVFGSLVVVGTLAGWGPFGAVDDLALRALVVQSFVALTTALGLMLALGVAEKAALHARLRASEASATARAELLDAVTESITDGICVTDSWGHVVLANSAAAELAGNDGHGHHVHDPDDPGFLRGDGTRVPPWELPHARALRGERVDAVDVVRVDPVTGLERILQTTAVPLHHTASPASPDATEGVEAGPLAVVLLHDATRDRAEKRMLENFAGVVAHDLKGPLTGVLSWSEMAREQLDTDDPAAAASARDSLARIHRSALQMNQLITDLLDYTLTGSAELHVVDHSLDDVVDQVVADLHTTPGEPPLVEHGPLGHVLADALLTRQLVTNLLGNAVKYVEPGTRPHVTLEAVRQGDQLQVRVTDNGIGIPSSERGRVFDSFFRASSTTGAYPGTGLGLAICARAVERHGGTISAREGRGGVGTTMTFTLPATPGVLPLPPDPDVQEAPRSRRSRCCPRRRRRTPRPERHRRPRTRPPPRPSSRTLRPPLSGRAGPPARSRHRGARAPRRRSAARRARTRWPWPPRSGRRW